MEKIKIIKLPFQCNDEFTYAGFPGVIIRVRNINYATKMIGVEAPGRNIGSIEFKNFLEELELGRLVNIRKANKERMKLWKKLK